MHILIQLLQAVIVRPLSSVSALVRFAEEPQMFAVEFNDGCPIHVSPCCLLKVPKILVLIERDCQIEASLYMIMITGIC